MSDYTANHKRLFRIGLTFRSLWVGLGLISFGSALSIIVLMYGLSVAVDTVFMQESSLQTVSGVLILFAAAVVVRGGLFWFSEILSQRGASRIKKELRTRMLRHIQKLGPVWSEQQSSGELASTAVEGVEKLDAYYARFMPAAIHMAVVPVVIAVFVFYMDWLSGLILIVTGPLIPVFMSLIGMRAQSQTRKQWQTMRNLSSHFVDTVQGLRTLKLFDRTRRKQLEIEQFSDRFRKTTMGVLKIAFLSGFVLELFASIATALVAVEIGVRLIEGHIVFQTGFFILLLAPEYYLPFRMFGAQHHAGMEGTEAAGRIFEILDTPPRTTSHRDTIAVPAAPYHIHFDRVRFAYPGNRTPTIDRCSFFLEPNRTTALVGRSGSGKTTISRLLTRQVLPESGQITVNGVTSDLMDPAEWLKQIAVVNQDVWLFDGSVHDNLKAARPDAPFEDIVNAAKLAEAHDMIMQLPDGYSTRTGERAVRFSGGERQRLAIARAFLRDAPVIILDEPSSALDPESEFRINVALERLLERRTVLVIAHRLSTVRNADHILVLEDGKISEQGTHRQLLQSSRLYYKMATAYQHNRE